MEIGKIINGHINAMLGLNKNLSEVRLKICKQCPLYSTKLGGVCNSRLYLNPDTGDVSTTKKDGYIRGCGCSIPAKTALVTSECPVNKW